MKSRFFFGVFVGFIVASVFFFFFFGVARAQTPTPSPQKQDSAYQRNYRGETGEMRYRGDVATYRVTTYDGDYTSYSDDRASDDYYLAEYGGYAGYDTAAAYKGRAGYNYRYAEYDVYRQAAYAGVA